MCTTTRSFSFSTAIIIKNLAMFQKIFWPTGASAPNGFGHPRKNIGLYYFVNVWNMRLTRTVPALSITLETSPSNGKINESSLRNVCCDIVWVSTVDYYIHYMSVKIFAMLKIMHWELPFVQSSSREARLRFSTMFHKRKLMKIYISLGEWIRCESKILLCGCVRKPSCNNVRWRHPTSLSSVRVHEVPPSPCRLYPEELYIAMILVRSSIWPVFQVGGSRWKQNIYCS